MSKQPQEAAAIAALCVVSASIMLLEEQKEKEKKKKARIWVKEWRLRRDTNSSFKFLTSELRLEDKDAYRRYLRMNEESFVQILEYIKSSIKKQDTVLRKSICPEETLVAVFV